MTHSETAAKVRAALGEMPADAHYLVASIALPAGGEVTADRAAEDIREIVAELRALPRSREYTNVTIFVLLDRDGAPQGILRPLGEAVPS